MLTFKLLSRMHISIFKKFSLLRRFMIAALPMLLLQLAIGAQEVDDDRNAVAIFNEAQDLHEKGDLEGAIKIYEKALRLLPEFAEAEYQRGVAHLALGSSDEAEKAFRRAVELRPDWTLAMASLGSLLVHKDRLPEAEKILQKVIEIEPSNPPALAALTELLLKTGASQAVLQDLLGKIVFLTSKAKPTASLWTAQAALENATLKRSAAKSSLANALAIDPKNRTALFQIADIALAEGDLTRASEIARRLGTASANADRLHHLKANIFAQEGKFDEAIKELDAIARPDRAAAELRSKIDVSQAANPADLEKQLEADSRNSVILGRLCSVFRRDDPLKALDYCRRASEAEPGNINYAVGFGAALVQAKQFDAAVAVLRKLLEIAPDNATAHANLATALFQLKRLPEAKTEFLWLTNAQPSAAGAYLFLGIIHDQRREYIDAAANYQQYLRLADPVQNKLDIEKVQLRLPEVQKLIKKK